MESGPRAACRAPVLHHANAGPRHAWIDLLKAVGIISVVWIHAFCRLGENPPLTARIAYLTRFAVPAFFFVAGFLQASSPRIGVMEFASRRLVRLVIPYLVASAAAFPVRQALEGSSLTVENVILGLFNGDALGIYYFVPLLVGVTSIGEAAFRFPALAWPLWGVFATLALLSETQLLSVGDLWWEIRNPLRWWGYFLAGWVMSEQRLRISELPARLRQLAGWWILGIAAVIVCYYVHFLPPVWSRQSVAMQYVMIYAVLLGTALTAWDAPCRPFVRWLSEASYPIYLYHYFVIMVARAFVWGLPDTAVFVVACGTTMIGVVGMRRTCGVRARLIIG
jgi:peptidoglycan/LPS O-acetylase OafA/YrhL